MNSGEARGSADAATEEARFFAAIVASASEAIIAKTVDGRITSWNPAAEQLYGYTRGEVLGRHIKLIVPQDKQRELREVLERIEAGERIAEFETVRLRKDGARVDVAVTVSPIRNGRGEVIGGATVARDIGERNRAEASLVASENRMRAMLDAALDAVIMLDVHGRIVEFNEAAESMFGRPREQAIDGDLADLIIPAQFREAHREGLRRFRENGEAPVLDRELDLAALRADGTEFPVRLRITQVETDGEQQFVGYVSDLSELRRSEENYRTLFDRHPAPMWVYDPTTLRFLAVNDAAVELYGYSREEFLGMTIEEIRPPEDVPALHEAIRDPTRLRVQSTGWRHRRRDGSLIDVMIVSDSVEFEGRAARIVLTWDVTELRGLEEQLRRAQKMEAIGRLAGGIAHDFNSLLMVVQLAAAEIERNPMAVDRHSLDLIQDTVGRAAALTRQLLAFSRRKVLHLERTDLNDIVRETNTLLERLLGEDIALSTRLAPALSAMLADRGQLGQVILNLAVNARDAMPNGGSLLIETAEVDLDDSYTEQHIDVTPGRYIVLRVTDDGIGMDEETRLRAFDPFFTTKETGSGLGLATVYGIVRQSGGHVYLYSEPNMGTTFKLYFPAHRDEETPRAVAAGPVSTPRHGSETILLVEDDDALRPLLARTLEEHGYIVLQAANANDALGLAAEPGREIDLLITDVVMPGINGRELAERLEEASPGVRVLYSSGYPADTMLRYGIPHAAVSFIEKPYGSDDLLAKVREALDAT